MKVCVPDMIVVTVEVPSIVELVVWLPWPNALPNMGNMTPSATRATIPNSMIFCFLVIVFGFSFADFFLVGLPAGISKSVKRLLSRGVQI